MTKLVWLDAGHGGTDPGAVGNKLQEKSIVLNIVSRCGAYLLANYDNVSVRYSRTTDVFVALADRTSLANNAKADVFVSVHCNSAANESANGFETFVTNTKLTAGSTDLQTAVHNAVWDFYKKNRIKSDRGRKSQNLHVLRESNMPSVLTENLFMPNAEILNFNNTTFLQGVAEAHAKGIASYLKLKAKKATGNTHVVKAGETLTSIAKLYSVTVNAIATANNIADPNKLSVNQVLTIPTGSTATNTIFFPATPTVGSGLVDTLNSIGVDSSFANRQRIATANKISNYTGTVAQNNQMLSLLNQGKLVRP